MAGREVQRREMGGTLSAGEELVAGGAALVRIENEHLMQVALQRPREPAKVCEAVLAELALAPELAEKAYYTLPFKNHKPGCQKRKTCDCPKNEVRGVGIDGALMLARHWRNCTATVRIVSDDVETVTLEGVFLDLETNVRLSKPKAASKFATTKGGQRYRMRDSELEKAVGAAASKAERNAILDGIPKWLRQRFYDRAREIAAEHERQKGAKGKSDGAKLSPEEATKRLVAKILERFGAHGVGREMLESYLRCELEAVDDDQIGDLRGIANALDEGELSPGEVFDEDLPEDEGAETRTADDVIGAGADVTGGVEAGDPMRDEPPWQDGPPNEKVSRGGRTRPKRGRRQEILL